MTTSSPSPFIKPEPGLRIKKGAPNIPRPSKKEIELFPREAKKLVDSVWTAQKSLLENNKYDLRWIEGRHLVLAGATGPGLGGALATAVLNLVGDTGSLTVIARDLSRSIGYETGIEMQARAAKAGLENRFHWINSGIAIGGDRFGVILSALKEAGANRVVYINTVAAAHSGVVPGNPPVFVKDVDEEGLFQWELTPLNGQSVETTKYIMGTMAVQFPHELEKAGIRVEASAFADWRGSLDRISRNPDSVDYGKWGPYSTSLYLPKDILQKETIAAFGSGRIVMDFFFPVMKTRALTFIPGGQTLSCVYKKLMKSEKIRFIDIPELALGMLEQIGRAIEEGDINPFPRLDSHEAPFDLWFFEIVKRLNKDENSEFYYKRWIFPC